MARQQERARRTRAAIIRSAAVEFGKSGYAAASLNRILEGSRATKGAMYFHFDSKEDLARAVLGRPLTVRVAGAPAVFQQRPKRPQSRDSASYWNACGVPGVARCAFSRVPRAT